MKVCLICVEIFAWGKYGGFGRSTRMLGRELVKRGIEVTAVVPRREGQKEIEVLDGIRVLGFSRFNPLSMLKLFREADADVYHSQEPSFGTYLAQVAMPKRKHVVTFRDTRNFHDWWLEFIHPSKNYLQVLINYLYEDNFLVSRAVQRADFHAATANFLISKSQKKYGLRTAPVFLPSPIPFLEKIQKSDQPLVCFVGRLDRRKRPQIFFELARRFPDVKFIAVGAGQDGPLDFKLREQYGDIKNLEIVGFLDQFGGDELINLLGKSWILINTSVREGLPTSFIEASGHGCAILSEIDPDGFSTYFGYHVKNGNYVAGLQYLLADNHWRELGVLGRRYASDLFELQKSIHAHMQVYENILNG
jgi:glycosyltransferase involved in cell wall biosynthesis